MRAIVFAAPGDPDVLHLSDDVPLPPLVPNGVRIRVAATAVNRADTVQRRGKYPPPVGASPILGLECAGTVLEAAPGVAFAPGDPVMALLSGGGYAEQCVADAGSVLPIPAGFSLEQAAAFMEATLTAFLNIFQLAAVQPGEQVLVHGGGSGVGTQAIALCRAEGLKIVVTAGSDDKCHRCRDRGADLALNYRDRPFDEALAELIPGGVNVILDSIGGPYFAGNLAALAPDGRLVIIATMGGAQTQISLPILMQKRLHVFGSTLRARPAAAKAALVRGLARRFAGRLTALTPVVDQVFPLAEAAAAHRHLEASQHFGKIVLRT